VIGTDAANVNGTELGRVQRWDFLAAPRTGDPADFGAGPLTLDPINQHMLAHEQTKIQIAADSSYILDCKQLVELVKIPCRHRRLGYRLRGSSTTSA
jgi:hypothetical protein